MTTPAFKPPAFLNDIADKLSALAKNSPAADIEQNLKAGLTAMLGRLDLVTREEFDVQAELLARAQAQLTRLETRLAALERTTSVQPSPKADDLV
jgi:BMFP domain-containing protein YqiC